MLVFAKVGVKGHVPKHALGRVRPRRLQHPLENSLGTSVHCRILENFPIPDLYVLGGTGPGGLVLDCWVRSWRVDFCRVDRSGLWILRVLGCTLGCNIVFQLPGMGNGAGESG